jgi:hypothetical protein
MDNSPIPAVRSPIPAASSAIPAPATPARRFRTPDRFRGRSSDYVYQAALLLAALLLILTATIF